MKKSISIIGAVAILAIIVGLVSVYISQKTQVFTRQPVSIYFSENSGTTADARLWWVELTRDAAGAVSGSYVLKDGTGALLAEKAVPLSSQKFEEIFTAAQKITPMSPAEPCAGGGGKVLDVTAGSTTLSFYSLACGPKTVNQSLEAFSSAYIEPLIVGQPTR